MYEKVEKIAQQILPYSQYYSVDILAKLYLLLAIVTSNKNEIDKAFTYVQSGLNVDLEDQKVRLALLLKLANVHMAKKQFQQLLNIAEDLVALTLGESHEQYKLLALSYRSVAFAMLGQYEQALADLMLLDKTVDKRSVSIEHIEFFTILATAYHYLGDYQTALTIQLKVLKLRFDLNKKENIDQTYLYIGYAYLYLQRFDDAYSAFWEAKKYAQQRKKPIGVALADKGVGLSFFKLQQFEEADRALTQAAETFKNNNVITEYIETLVALASIKMSLQEKDKAYDILLNVLSLLKGEEISLEYVGFYRMLAEMYFDQGDYQQAYLIAQKHSQLLWFKFENKKKEAKYTHYFYNQTLTQALKKDSLGKGKKLAIKLAGNSEMITSFQRKYHKQHTIILILLSLLMLFAFGALIYYFRLRANKAEKAYEELDEYRIITNAQKTKLYYQEAYQKARKFQYPLSVCYISIENWQELVFTFNKKQVAEVKGIMVSIIQEQLAEFEFAGVLNEGEYLLLFEHQSELDVSGKAEKLVEALNSLFFGSLGDFSLMIKFKLDSPTFKDIDPFSFLAKLTDTAKAKSQS
ncbi:hypothetical protein KO495_09660 [Colwellia sp. D2M02]|uniref:tetratricopeptide repeat protein n=1 Tax=Colwellia sp. D2M02 TaxID=2841562 RepID=UPI001C08CDD8|nr:hypothetical protein [Colwellia sp. D2M02]MBU2893584.1 hypothetical protein [Colwellia sp. D2M02]